MVAAFSTSLRAVLGRAVGARGVFQAWQPRLSQETSGEAAGMRPESRWDPAPAQQLCGAGQKGLKRHRLRGESIRTPGTRGGKKKAGKLKAVAGLGTTH